MKFGTAVMLLKVTSTTFFLISLHSFNHTKIEDVQTSELDAKLVPVNAGSCNFVC